MATKKKKKNKRVVRRARAGAGRTVKKTMAKTAKKKIIRVQKKKAVRAIKRIGVKNKARKITKVIARKPEELGKIVHYYPNISVAVVEVKRVIKQGDWIQIRGHGEEFEQEVVSMQIDYKPLTSAKKGQVIGMKVIKPVKENYLVFKR